MFGFAGWVEFNNRPRDAKVLEKLLYACESDGQCEFELVSNDYISLCRHDTVNSPRLFTQHDLRFIGHARLDDKRSLLKKLAISSDQATSIPDEQLLFSAYLKWGDTAVDHLLGDFIFAVWDAEKGRLTLCRDPIGSKTFFYYHHHDRLLFSTALSGLVACGLIQKQLNKDKLLDYLILEQQDALQTFFKNINIVPAGHLIRIESANVQSNKYWQPDINKRIHFSDTDELYFQFRTLFETAVEDRLDESNNHAVMLSGGLDSASIACSAAKNLAAKKRNLSSYTSIPLADFKQTPKLGVVYDETPYVESIKLQYPNIKTHYLDAKNYDVLSVLAQTIETTCMPPRNLVNQLWIQAIVDKAAQDDINHLLTGFCGNYFVSVAGMNVFNELFESGRWLQLHRQLSLYSQLNALSYLDILKRQVLTPLISKNIWRIYQQKRFGRSISLHREIPINQDLISSKEISDRCKDIDPYYRASRNWRKQSVSVLDIFSGDVATMESGLSMQSGVSLLDPTRDKRLIEFCLSLPTDQFLNDGRSRLLIRDGLATILPEEIQTRSTFGYQDADRALRLNQARQNIAIEINKLCKHDTVRQYIDVDKMKNLIESSSFEDSYSANLVSRGLSISKFIAWVES